MTVVARLVDVVKSYGGTTVLHQVNLALTAGSIHGLIGENGAGKSTLMKILSGVERPTSGHVEIAGETRTLRSPHDALRQGVSIITQELATVPARPVLENVFLGDWANRAGVVTTRRDRARFRELCEEVGFTLDPDAPMGDLSLAQQQQVEILKAVSRGSRVLILDEPTAMLTQSETEVLLDIMRRLAAKGVALVLVSHFLAEVLSVCDQVTVLRDGRHVLTDAAANQNVPSLVRAMIGRDMDELYPELPDVAEDAPVVLSVRGLSRGTAVRDVDLDIRAGEIVGLAGLVGSGRTELARLIFGADRPDAGTISIDGKAVSLPSPAAAMRRGIGMVPESRKEHGLLLDQGVRDNVTLVKLRDTSTLGVRRPGLEKKLAEHYAGRLDVRGAALEGPVWTLSGGNQQKVLFAKWIARQPRLLIIDEPTRGVDVGAKLPIHQLVAELAAEGKAVLLISSEIEEVMGLAHRIVVLRQGRVSAMVDRNDATQEGLLAAAFADKEQQS